MFKRTSARSASNYDYLVPDDSRLILVYRSVAIVVIFFVVLLGQPISCTAPARTALPALYFRTARFDSLNLDEDPNWSCS